jgi:hypothetical protein
MGFLKNLKAGLEAAQAASAQPVNDVPPFVNPWPQEEVDRLLQGTGTIRAILLGYQHQVLEGNERVGAMGVQIRLRPRGPGGTLGDEVTVKATMSSWNARLLELGLDIPVERDASGAITKVASKQLAAELESRADEAKKGNSGWTLDPDVEGMIDVAKAVFGKPSPAATAPVPPSDPRLAPVEGLGYEGYVAIRADLMKNGAPNGEDAVAQEHGVRPYTWLAISTVWKNRIALDPELTAMYERDLAAQHPR